VERMITRDSDSGAGHKVDVEAAALIRKLSDLESAAMGVKNATNDLREQLDTYDFVVGESLSRAQAGMRIRDIVRTLSPAEAVAGSEVGVIKLFDARRALRKALVGALLADGMPIGEIASTFQVPIQSICDLADDEGKSHEQ